MTSNWNHSRRFVCLALALAPTSAAPILANEQDNRSAELQVADGSHSWADFGAEPVKKCERNKRKYSRGVQLKSLKISVQKLTYERAVDPFYQLVQGVY